MEVSVAAEVAAFIVSILLLISRFVQSAKPVWGRLPKTVAVLLPAVVSLIPQVIELLSQTKTWADLGSQLIASVSIVLVGLFPSHERTTGPTSPGGYGGGGPGGPTSREPHDHRDPLDKPFQDHRQYPPDPPAY